MCLHKDVKVQVWPPMQFFRITRRAAGGAAPSCLAAGYATYSPSRDFEYAAPSYDLQLLVLFCIRYTRYQFCGYY
eukprot:SAG31_NODE_2921_length_4909_cov_2.815385_3_plen_75_part_00